ncbi:MAG: hypothetical protein R3F25_00885 [Gammaproteobacteria bacterium]|jgi:hypothetical protein
MMTENFQENHNDSTLPKRRYFFHIVEIISALAYTYFVGFSGILWIAVAISLLSLVIQTNVFSKSLSTKATFIISQLCLVISSIIWGYLVMYFLSSAPKVFTIILVARVIATIVGFKEIRDQAIVVLPLLIGFVFIQQQGCIPPLDF